MQAAKHAIKDRPSQWSSHFEPAPQFDQEAYQNKLNRIAGFTQQGEPVLRLVWGGNESKMRAVAFDDFGNPIEWAKVPRYAFESKKFETWGVLIPIRRWIIEENTDAGQVEAMGGKQGNIDVPEKGFYTPYIIIADHSKCQDCKASEFKCFGDYKAPGYEELQFITEVTYKLTLERKQDPRAGLDMDLVAEIVRSEAPNEEEEKAVEEEENRKFIRNWLNTHIPIRSLPSEPKSLNYATTSSGEPASKI